jgi:hypothetical protein
MSCLGKSESTSDAWVRLRLPPKKGAAKQKKSEKWTWKIRFRALRKTKVALKNIYLSMSYA